MDVSGSGTLRAKTYLEPLRTTGRYPTYAEDIGTEKAISFPYKKTTASGENVLRKKVLNRFADDVANWLVDTYYNPDHYFTRYDSQGRPYDNDKIRLLAMAMPATVKNHKITQADNLSESHGFEWAGVSEDIMEHEFLEPLETKLAEFNLGNLISDDAKVVFINDMVAAACARVSYKQIPLIVNSPSEAKREYPGAETSFDWLIIRVGTGCGAVKLEVPKSDKDDKHVIYTTDLGHIRIDDDNELTLEDRLSSGAFIKRAKELGIKFPRETQEYQMPALVMKYAFAWTTKEAGNKRGNREKAKQIVDDGIRALAKAISAVVYTGQSNLLVDLGGGIIRGIDEAAAVRGMRGSYVCWRLENPSKHWNFNKHNHIIAFQPEDSLGRVRLELKKLEQIQQDMSKGQRPSELSKSVRLICTKAPYEAIRFLLTYRDKTGKPVILERLKDPAFIQKVMEGAKKVPYASGGFIGYPLDKQVLLMLEDPDFLEKFKLLYELKSAKPEHPLAKVILDAWQNPDRQLTKVPAGALNKLLEGENPELICREPEVLLELLKNPRAAYFFSSKISKQELLKCPELPALVASIGADLELPQSVFHNPKILRFLIKACPEVFPSSVRDKAHESEVYPFSAEEKKEVQRVFLPGNYETQMKLLSFLKRPRTLQFVLQFVLQDKSILRELLDDDHVIRRLLEMADFRSILAGLHFYDIHASDMPVINRYICEAMIRNPALLSSQLLKYPQVLRSLLWRPDVLRSLSRQMEDASLLNTVNPFARKKSGAGSVKMIQKHRPVGPLTQNKSKTIPLVSNAEYNPELHIKPTMPPIDLSTVAAKSDLLYFMQTVNGLTILLSRQNYVQECLLEDPVVQKVLGEGAVRSALLEILWKRYELDAGLVDNLQGAAIYANAQSPGFVPGWGLFRFEVKSGTTD